MSFRLPALNRLLMRFRCREDMQFGIICLHHPSSFEHFHAWHALELVEQWRALGLVKQSRLKSHTLFATFASEPTGAVQYGFNGGVAFFQETREQALEMFDIALCNPVRLDLLLEELAIISKGAVVRRRGT